MSSKMRLYVCPIGFILCFFGVCVSSYPGSEENTDSKVCYGENLGITMRGTPQFRYKEYIKRYTNCTYVMGNLEIVSLEEEGQTYDLSFLSNIREVTGYVLLYSIAAEVIPLSSLRTIRGMTLYYHEELKHSFSLLVMVNFQRNHDYGLKELHFNNLTEILNGGVYFQDNPYLCYENTINWKDINPTGKPPVTFSDKMPPRRICGECHPSCKNKITNTTHCWGPSPSMCQTLTFGEVCHPNCGGNRCYGSQPNECCHPECAGGCFGPRKTECFACRNFVNEGSCEAYCPRETIYDKKEMRNVDNPEKKYAFGSKCVKVCPDHLLQDQGFCVKTCAKDRHANDGRNCKPCNGPCPKACLGLNENVNDYLTAQNLKNFEDCTKIDGNLIILGQTFKHDPHFNITALHPSELSVLRHVKEITGFLMVQSDHPDFVDLSFLSSLQVIQGRNTHGQQKASISILSTPLRSLELISLKTIRNGNVVMLNNKQLCFASTIDWSKLFQSQDQTSHLTINGVPEDCEQRGDVCHEQCGREGCWGRGPSKCLMCANYKYEKHNLCLNLCTDIPRLYHKGQGKCEECDSECNNTCNGPKNTDCDKCANVIIRDNKGIDSCEPVCPLFMYADMNKVCRQCHPFCGSDGCWGNNRSIGSTGCKTCEIGVKEDNGTVSCLHHDTQVCDKGYFMTSHSTFLSGKVKSFQVCEKCNFLCLECTAYDTQYCNECRYFRSGKYCVRECPVFNYGDTFDKQCKECDTECRGGCFGPSSHNCTACSNFKIYTSNENKTFNCTPECPPHLPYNVRDNEFDENRIVCADGTHPDVLAMADVGEETFKRNLIIIIACAFTALLFLILLICFFRYKRARNMKKAAKYTAKITGCEDIEPLTPTSVRPDLSKMRIVNESELRRGAIIGTGAFGTVYKGMWVPQGENVKIPVAIKVLSDGTSPGKSTELLEEARVMCSVDHLCCVRILAVCMSSQMMLITQLMPHASLLEYVKENKRNIGSKALLNWCTQIARGMSYLEEHGIVHRDLAARNVLVQTPKQVKITDFGLAKLLEHGEAEYRAHGGLMPIKWLALECIQHRTFTHKSDVWSYGVTMWELFSYGEKPYDGINNSDVPMMLEKGERLQQPTICTIDVYMIMVKCWMLDAESRPSFKELAEEFSKMSRDPGRYLVIEGDQLMRLPSMSYDKHELVRGMSHIEGNETIVEAEEYVQQAEGGNSDSLPRNGHTRSHNSLFERQFSSSHMPPTAQSNLSLNTNSLEKRRHDGQKVREKKYAHLNAAARAKSDRMYPNGRGDSVSSRYSSDPIKFSKSKGELEWPAVFSDETDSHLLNGDMPFLPPPIKKPNKPIAVDEDNYLLPKFPPSAAGYTDLNDKGYYQNEKTFGSTSSSGSRREEKDDIFNYTSKSPSTPNKGVTTFFPPAPTLTFNPQTSAVSNPGYYESRLASSSHEDEYDDNENVWETKDTPMVNGYHQIPLDNPSSPGHMTSKSPYCNEFQNYVKPKVNTKVSINGRHPSESKV